MKKDKIQDLVIGIAIGYDYQMLKNWIGSLNQSGFQGRKVLILGGSDDQTIKKVATLGIEIEIFDVPEDYVYNLIVVDRFLLLYMFLRDNENNSIRYVVVTDVKDVIFQKNPSEYFNKMELNSGKEIIVASESIKYKDEKWGLSNLIASFPEALDRMEDRVIFNAGTIAGRPLAISELALQIFLMSKNNPISNPDQAAMNIILSSNPWSSITKFATQEDAWAFQAGTTLDPGKAEEYLPFLTEKPAMITSDFRVTNSGGGEYVLLHQYDRVPSLRAYFDKKYP